MLPRRKRMRSDSDGAAASPSRPKAEVVRRWRFSVRASALAANEVLCVTGDCQQLGCWAPARVLQLAETPVAGVWGGACEIPAGVDVHYRYCVCIVSRDSSSSRHHVLVRSWETELNPRSISEEQTPADKPETYGLIGSTSKIDKGWLTTENLLQFKFYKNPFAFKSAIRDGTLLVKLIPVNYQFGSENASSPIDDSLNADTNDAETPSCIVSEVSTLNAVDCQFKPQEQFGRVYNKNDFLIFNVTAPNLHSLAYLMDFYKYSSKASPGDPPRHIGYSYILPNLLKKSEGQIELPITCSSKHRPLGSMIFDYLTVYPMQEQLCDMRISYSSYWNESWKGLDVGHRGLGSSFKAKEGTSIRENTVASLKTAAASGADMLEFDVQLSKDLVPVIYHDFHVCIALKRKKQMEFTEMLEIPMKDLTLDQLQDLKVYHVVEGRSNEPRFFDEDLAEHQPFPKLSEILNVIDPHVGFNIEIKWTMLREDGSMELQHPFDLNLYIDKILKEVLRSAGSRRIIFSCFHPDICTMVRLKQNTYPVMFLTQGVTTRYPSYHDLRCNSIPAAIYHSLSSNLLGIVVHTEDLLRDSTQVKLVTDAGLIIFCWGDDNNNTDTIKYLKQLGLHGVIYDKLDQYSTKEVKESIFLLEARGAQKELIRLASTDGSGCSSENDKLLSGVNDRKNSAQQNSDAKYPKLSE